LANHPPPPPLIKFYLHYFTLFYFKRKRKDSVMSYYKWLCDTDSWCAWGFAYRLDYVQSVLAPERQAPSAAEDKVLAATTKAMEAISV
jgi:hypothetical protein